jgi:hypothetical protein
MALIPSILENGLKSLATIGLISTREEVATKIADIYNQYAMTAQHGGMLNPTKVNYSTMLSSLIASFSQEYIDNISPAQDWSNAFYDFWCNAEFGATGRVTFAGNKSQLTNALVIIWDNSEFVNENSEITLSKMSDAIDAFTRTVLANDTALPQPTPCVTPCPLI